MLTILGEGRRSTTSFCSAAYARRHLQHGGSRFVAYVFDARENKKKIVDDVSIVREFPDVFLDDLPRIPPERERQVEFRINLIPSAAPIA